MQVPYGWGRPVGEGVFAIGGGEWVITWSPEQMHPYALQWLKWASGFGPDPRQAPPPDLWAYGLQTKNPALA